MNSSNIKHCHAKTYEQFFLENNVVISAPFVMNRSGDVLNNYSGISIKQKIPLRIYMGVSRNSGSQVILNKIHYLDINEQEFIQTNIIEYAPYFIDIQKELQKKYTPLAQEFGGIEINILSELPRGVGLGFGSIITLLLATLFQRIQETVLPDEIHSFAQQNINDLLADTGGKFYQLFLESLNLDKHMYGMVSSGTKLAAFFDTHYPVVSFCEDFDKTIPHTDLATKRFFGFKMNDVFQGFRDIPYSPIDYGLVYSGKPVMLEQIAGSQYKSNSISAKEIKTEFKNLFGDFLEELPSGQRPRFYKHLVAPENDEFDLTYGKVLGIISLKIFYFMSKIYGDGYDESNMLQLLEVLRQRRQADCATRDSSSTFLDIIKRLLEHFQGSPKYFSLSPNDSTIMGGTLLFAAPLEGFRNMIVDTVQETAKEFTGVNLLYNNWVDGIESRGMRVEQDLKANIYSDLLESNNCVIRRACGKIMVADCEDSIINHKSGLLLDTLHSKIYINGEKLTSQDLHSQSATIEIIRILMQNLGNEVHNKNLPPSTYSKSKNEMVSKIVIPILELVEKKLGKKLPLICKGSLYDFYMKLNKSDIDIAIISRLIREEFL